MAKFEQWGAGSRRAPQRRAERAARRSQKRESERRWRRDEQGRMPWWTDPTSPIGAPEPAIVALAQLYMAVQEFGRDLDELARRIECPSICT